MQQNGTNFNILVFSKEYRIAGVLEKDKQTNKLGTLTGRPMLKYVDDQVLQYKRRRQSIMNKIAIDNSKQVPVPSPQQNLTSGVHFQNFKSVKMKLP